MLADLRFALRNLRRTPVFAIVAILSLALGIGTNTAIFSLLDQVLLRLLPVKNPQDLVKVHSAKGAFSGSSRCAGDSGNSAMMQRALSVKDCARSWTRSNPRWRSITQRIFSNGTRS